MNKLEQLRRMTTIVIDTGDIDAITNAHNLAMVALTSRMQHEANYDDAKLAANFRQALAHVRQSVPFPANPLRVEPAPVIGDRDFESRLAKMQGDPHFGRAGVSDHILHGFARGEQKVVAHLRAQFQRRDRRLQQHAGQAGKCTDQAGRQAQ